MLMLRSVARRGVACVLPITAVVASRHILTPRHSLSSCEDSSSSCGKGKSFFGFIDKAKWSSSAKNPPTPASEPVTAKPSRFDNYTQNILSDLRSAMDKHESKLREKASLHESSILEVLSFHKNKMDELKDTFIKADFFDIIPGSIIDDNTKSSLRDLSLVCENIISQYQRTVTTFNHPFLVNLGILRLYSIEQARQTATASLVKTCAMKGIGGSDAARDVFLAEVRHFMRYADDVYEDKSSLYLSPSDFLARELDVRRPQADDDEGGSTLLQHPRYVVFLDHLTQSQVVVIRGTASVSDIITDLHCSTRPFINDSLHAHTGISASAEALFDPVMAALEKGRTMKGGAFHNYKVVVTGHSLGAGTASLLSLLLAHQNPAQHITTYAFAPPPILAKVDGATSGGHTQPTGFSDRLLNAVRQQAGPGAGDLWDKVAGEEKTSWDTFRPSPSVRLKEAAQEMLNPAPDLPLGSPPLPHNLTIHSFVHNEDLIPRCSMHEFMNMLTAVNAIDKYPNWSASDRAAILIRGELSKEELTIIKDALCAATSNKELTPSEDRQLVIPGHLYWLLPREVTPNSAAKSSKIVNTGSEWSEGGVEGEGEAAIVPVREVQGTSGSNFALIRMQSCQDIFSGSLLTGDSMFQDHLAGSYKNAMVSIDTRMD